MITGDGTSPVGGFGADKTVGDEVGRTGAGEVEYVGKLGFVGGFGLNGTLLVTRGLVGAGMFQELAGGGAGTDKDKTGCGDPGGFALFCVAGLTGLDCVGEFDFVTVAPLFENC